jgi:hypothetical protein
VSLSLAPFCSGILRVTRVTIRDLFVQDIVIPAGTLLSECRVVRQSAGLEPYLVHFASEGCWYTCPLYVFQPRTQALGGESAAVEHAADALAI